MYFSYAHLRYPQDRGQSGAPPTVEGQRGSWASFDLRSSQPDPLIAGLLDHVDAETIDEQNEVQIAPNIRFDFMVLETFYVG